MGCSYRAELSQLTKVQTYKRSFTIPDLPLQTSFSSLFHLVFLNHSEPHCSSTLLPVGLSRSSHKCSLSLVGLAGSAGRTLLAWRVSGAVVARWLVAACEGWRQYTRLKYQLGIQTHPWTKRGFFGSLFFSLCVCVGTSACTCTQTCLHMLRVYVCLDTRPTAGCFLKRGAILYICVQRNLCLFRRHTHVLRTSFHLRTAAPPRLMATNESINTTDYSLSSYAVTL